MRSSTLYFFASHRNPFEILTGYERLLRWHEGWPRFWRAFGFLYDHEALVLPEYREGFGWSIVTPPFGEWSASRLLHEVCGRMFPTLQFYSDEKINKVTSFQELIDTHVVLVRDTVEADECHKGKSVEFIEQNKIPAITLRQREVLEARYYFETGGHLDVVNFTLCCGSRYSGGDVPHAYWRGGKFHVGRVHPADEDGHWRVRELSL